VGRYGVGGPHEKATRARLKRTSRSSETTTPRIYDNLNKGLEAASSSTSNTRSSRTTSR
jgi:hypothetical protein